MQPALMMTLCSPPQSANLFNIYLFFFFYSVQHPAISTGLLFTGLSTLDHPRGLELAAALVF